MALERRLLPDRGPGRLALAASILLGISTSGLVIAQARVLALVVSGATRGAAAGTLGAELAGLVGLALLRAAAAWGAEWSAAWAAASVRQSLRAALTASFFSRGPRFVAGERSGELAGTMLGGVESTDAYVARYLPQIALSVAVPLMVGAAVLHADALSGFVLAATWPLIPLFMYLVGGVSRARAQAQFVTLSRLSARFLDALQGIPTLVALGRAEDEVAVIARLSDRSRVVTMGVLKVAFLSALTLEWLATLATAIVAVELGLRLLYGRIGFEAALFVLVVTPEFYRPLRALGAAFHAAMAGREACDRVSRLIGAPEGAGRTAAPMAPGSAAPMAPRTAPPMAPGSAPPQEPADLVLDDVSFRYAADRPPALDHVSFRVPAGSVLALVGPSGSGKSTTAHLALRFLAPDSGRILAGGRPLAELDAREWRKRVAWLSQCPQLFHGTVLDNLRLAKPDASASEIERALALAHADELVRALPGGLRAPVGEGGARLSGGEAQRLALARAFLRDAPFLVLDEPTSHLDPQNDALVTDGIRSLSRGRTVLLIAHRLTTVAEADSLVVLSAGRVIEQGAHETLVDAGGAYSRMVAALRGTS